MANALYEKGRNKFAQGAIHWLASGGDTVRAMLVDAAEHTLDLVNDEFLTDIETAARVGNAGGTGRTDMPTLTLAEPVGGVCDADDVTFSAVPTGGPYDYIIIFKDSGADATSPLIAAIDTATALPITTNGGDIVIQWASSANKIFKL